MKNDCNKNSHSSLIIYVCFLWLCLIIFMRFIVFDVNKVSGPSMNPTLNNGDILLMERMSLNMNELERYDIVTLDVHDKSRGWIRIIKRIIGMPGETIDIYSDGDVAINGHILTDDLHNNDTIVSDIHDILYHCELSDDEYYVLGDNRMNSADSRIYGPVNSNRIRGRVLYRLFPLSDMGCVSTIQMDNVK